MTNLISQKSTAYDSVKVHLTDKDTKQDLIFVSVLINDSIYRITDINGFVYIPLITDTTKLEFRYVGYKNMIKYLYKGKPLNLKKRLPQKQPIN